MKIYLYCETMTREYKQEVSWPFLPRVGEKVRFRQIRGRVKSVEWDADSQDEEKVYVIIEKED